ncbi:hypothetical protein ACP275_01G035300 [Erythranthe tilingii]
MAESEMGSQGKYIDSLLNLESLRKSLVRQEDTIIFCLIERSKYPINLPLYDDDVTIPCASPPSSLFHFFLKESESLQAKVLHPQGACININEKILNLYLKNLLPLIATKGDDGNYTATAASDLDCLQALSRRIHFGKFVAEVKFRNAPDDYVPAIRAKDRDGLMKLLTFESVEEVIKKRVEKKATVFGQDVVDLEQNNYHGKFKVDPSVVARLYGDWVIPLTKFVQVEYLLRRLD